jgi:hypothetical protein
VQLGAGVVTIVSASATYVVLGAAVASASPGAGATIGAIAGLLRGATLLAAARVRSPVQLVRFHARMRAWAGHVRIAGLAAHGSLLVAAAGALAA